MNVAVGFLKFIKYSILKSFYLSASSSLTSLQGNMLSDWIILYLIYCRMLVFAFVLIDSIHAKVL
jgi:hypothetical protein